MGVDQNDYRAIPVGIVQDELNEQAMPEAIKRDDAEVIEFVIFPVLLACLTNLLDLPTLFDEADQLGLDRPRGPSMQIRTSEESGDQAVVLPFDASAQTGLQRLHDK